ncbi:hypothetical protein [Candidatus Fokinia solitaria]|nr:hypothetical protein [Candidatus Fokinia solitaria]
MAVSFFSLLSINEEKRIQSTTMKMSIAQVMAKQEEPNSTPIEFDKVYQSVEERTFSQSVEEHTFSKVQEHIENTKPQEPEVIDEVKQLPEEKIVKKRDVDAVKKSEKSQKKAESKKPLKKEQKNDQNVSKKKKTEDTKKSMKKESIKKGQKKEDAKKNIKKEDIKKSAAKGKSDDKKDGSKKDTKNIKKNNSNGINNTSEERGFAKEGVSDEEKKAIIDQISEYYYLDYHHATDVMYVKIRFKVSKSGNIYDIKVMERKGVENNAYKKFVTNAILTLENASPLLKLPAVTKYDEWKEIVIEFDSSGKIG